MGIPLRRARAAPSARFGYLIRARQRTGLQGGRCGKERPAEVGSGEPQDRSAGGCLLPPSMLGKWCDPLSMMEIGNERCLQNPHQRI